MTMSGCWDFFNWLLGTFCLAVAILKALEFGIGAGAAALIAAMQPAFTALLAPLFLNERNSILQWVGVGVGFAGMAIFIDADSGASRAALWFYALPVLATASLTFVTVWERRRAAIELEIAANTSSPSSPNMPIFTPLFWQGPLTILLLLPLAQQFENFAADWRVELFLGVIWLAVIASVGAYGCFSLSVHARRQGFRHCNSSCRR